MGADAGYFAFEILLVAFAGGAIGAAIGGMAALSLSGLALVVALALGAGFGIASALIAELGGRVLYAHADTHVDPPAIAIVVTTLPIGLLTSAGVFEQGLVPAF